MNSKQTTGYSGEQIVAHFLKNEHFKIIEQNYRQSSGEIDIIAKKNDILAFVEVKTRKNPLISPLYAISKKKQRCIIKTAESYILKNKIENTVIRFDVAIVLLNNTNTPDVNYITNAFNL